MLRKNGLPKVCALLNAFEKEIKIYLLCIVKDDGEAKSKQERNKINMKSFNE